MRINSNGQITVAATTKHITFTLYINTQYDEVNCVPVWQKPNVLHVCTKKQKQPVYNNLHTTQCMNAQLHRQNHLLSLYHKIQQRPTRMSGHNKTMNLLCSKIKHNLNIYTRCHFIFDYYSRISWWLFYNFYTIGKRNEYSTIICNLLT